MIEPTIDTRVRGPNSIPTATRVRYGALVGATVTGLGVWVGESGGSGPRLWLGVSLVVGLILSSVAGLLVRRRSWRRAGVGVVLLALFATGHVRSDDEWQAVTAVQFGPYEGEAIVQLDPRPQGRGIKAVLEISGERFDVWGFGPMRSRLSRHQAGEVIMVKGVRRALESDSARRRHIRHVVGRFDIEEMMSAPSGSLSRASPLVLAAHRVRDALARGALPLSRNDSALFAGLVYGDDTDQPPEMIDRFRRSGLAHLTAVSGQNVAYILTMSAPVLTRLRRSTRWVLTMVILAWFVILTRQEASVIRASMMAAVGATVFAAGRQATGGQILGLAATVTLLVDPFLAWSVGWWLSMTGSGGLIFLTPVIVRAFNLVNSASEVSSSGGRRGPREGSSGWISTWIGPMLAAQIGVLPVSVLVFGVPSAWAIPCNLLAVPVAGVVMLLGMPAALISGFLPMPLAHVMMWPLGAGVRWVDTVAALGARLRLPTLINQIVAGVLVSLVLVAMWYHRRERHVTT